MVTGQTFHLMYPKAKLDSNNEAWDYDEDYVWEYIISIQDEFTYSKEFQKGRGKIFDQLNMKQR